MAAIPEQQSITKIVWTWIKHIPILSGIFGYLAFNLLSIILMGGFSVLALLTNLFPGLMTFFLSAVYNEGRKSKLKRKAILGA